MGSPSFFGVINVAKSNSRITFPDNLRACLPSNSDEHSVNREGCNILVHGGALAFDDGLVAAILGRPRWTDASLSAIARDRGHAAAAIIGFRQHGNDVVTVMTGEFGLLVGDTAQGHYLLSTDRLGRHPVFHATVDGYIIFASSATAVRAVSPSSFPVAAQSIYNYVYFHMVPAPSSIFRGIAKLQAAQCLHITSRNHDQIRTYWVPEFSEDSQADLGELQSELRDVIRTSVDDRLDHGAIGAFLSGGLDSSTVAGMLALARPGKASTYSMGFSAEGYDEIEYARIAAKHFGLNSTEYYVTPSDVAEALPLIASTYDEPFGNSSAVPTYLCAKRAASDGIEMMLAGDGGDELFAGNARYAKQAVFELYHQIPAGIRRSVIEPMGTRLPKSVPFLGKVRSYIEQAKVLLPDRLQTYNYLHRHAPDTIFAPDFFTQVDVNYPLNLQREIYRRPADASTLNRMLYLDWQQTLADNDLRKVSRMCGLAGIDVTYPLLDDRVVEFSCRIPSALKLRRGKLRYFYKQAMSGFLPDAIIHKSKHGFGLPFGVWMLADPTLRDVATSAIGALRQRGIFQASYLEQLLRQHREVHAAYFGEQVWVLMMLELWLQSNGF